MFLHQRLDLVEPARRHIRLVPVWKDQAPGGGVDATNVV